MILPSHAVEPSTQGGRPKGSGKRFTLIVVATALTCIGWSQAYGSENTYLCTVEHAYHVVDDGALAERDLAKFSALLGGSFSVDRRTGRVIGETVMNGRLANGQPKVMDYGGEGRSWIAYWEFVGTGHATVVTLEINEYVKGDLKPFLFSGPYGDILTGHCK